MFANQAPVLMVVFVLSRSPLVRLFGCHRASAHPLTREKNVKVSKLNYA